MEETISLKELMQTLRKRMTLIVLITVVAMVLSGAVSFFVLTPIYQSTTQLLVNQSKDDQPAYNPSEIQTNLQLINTYNQIMTSPRILDKVIADLDLDMTATELKDKISVESATDSQVVNVTVQDPDPNQAVTIANKVADVFEKDIVDLMNVDNVNILTKAEVGPEVSPVKPQPLLNIAIAAVVGLMLGVGIAFLLEYLDNTVKTAEDIEKLLELPMLGAVANIEDQKIQRKVNSSRSTRVRSEQVG
ncbi:capsular polysaccharide biosynthesis protein [Lederbergia ruris]|uniref:Capsular polysaccharide biosynthesis protein n=1 Tax=Lederbergia ruris TaxID=217495 RepID=A0ABQ4KLP9_9BACI|nr:Wzz/FepE/Etk N-terminal domain-containing protein [Lederbergia ruris]GIN58822.1 capsular polysaccharide biosynthesis protein [Lederbergia ruris]